MGKWEAELTRTAARSAENKESIDKQMEAVQKAVDAAQKFVSAHGKAAPKVAKASAEILEAEADCAELAGELMILEEQFEKAKKDKNDDEMKKIAAQMKPLISKFESGRKEMHSASADAQKAYEEIAKETVDLRAMLG
jgi:hypothetical protein